MTGDSEIPLYFVLINSPTHIRNDVNLRRAEISYILDLLLLLLSVVNNSLMVHGPDRIRFIH